MRVVIRLLTTKHTVKPGVNCNFSNCNTSTLTYNEVESNIKILIKLQKTGNIYIKIFLLVPSTLGVMTWPAVQLGLVSA